MENAGLDKYLPEVLEQMRIIATSTTNMMDLRTDFREHLRLYREDKQISDALIHHLEKSKDISNGGDAIIKARLTQRPHWHTATGTHILWLITLMILVLDILLRVRG